MTDLDKYKDGRQFDEPEDTQIDYTELLAKPIPAMTPELVQEIYPVRISNRIATECSDIINGFMGDMDSTFKEFYRDNVIGLIDILKEGGRKVKFKDYCAAVKFATYKMAGESDKRAYMLTFPERIQRMQLEKVPMTYIGMYSQSFAKSKVVTDVMAKMIIPSHIMFQDYFHLAVKTQVEIMMDNKVSPKVRSDAANSLMVHLKQPEVKKAELQINTTDNGAINSLAEALNALSGKQRELILEGNYSTEELRNATIIEVTN